MRLIFLSLIFPAFLNHKHQFFHGVKLSLCPISPDISSGFMKYPSFGLRRAP
jgi:hypothetical protein